MAKVGRPKGKNNKEYNYQMGVHYMDIISECEKLGDYVVNVVEARTDIKEKKIQFSLFKKQAKKA